MKLLSTQNTPLLMTELYAIREYRKTGDDRSLVFSSFLRSYVGAHTRQAHRLPQFWQRIPHSVIFKEYEGRWERALEHPDTRVIMAVLPSDPDEIMGWMAYRPGMLLYVFVKRNWRKLPGMNIASSLWDYASGDIESTGRIATPFSTYAGLKWLDKVRHGPSNSP